MGRKAKHDKNDWILAAFQTLGDDGIDGVKVERIAKRLGTTKGSFYWHFTDRPTLLNEMLNFWDQEGTRSIIEQLSAANISAAEQLKRLARVATETRTHGLDAIAVEGALRAWAGQDQEVADRITKTERARIGFVSDLLTAIGYADTDASALAHQMYLMLLGLYSISRHDKGDNHRNAFIGFADRLAARDD